MVNIVEWKTTISHVNVLIPPLPPAIAGPLTASFCFGILEWDLEEGYSGTDSPDKDLVRPEGSGETPSEEKRWVGSIPVIPEVEKNCYCVCVVISNLIVVF